MFRRPINKRVKNTKSDEQILLATTEKYVDAAEDEMVVIKRTRSRVKNTFSPDLKGIGYFVLDALGSGTYGDVYLAEHMTTGQRVAVKRSKEIRSCNGVPTDVLREASLLRSVRHENILELIDINIYESARGTMPEGFVRSILRQLTNGLQCMHSRQIAHRDLKPLNILLKSCGILKIADFGMCRFMDAPAKIYTNEVVTLFYRPPELLLGASTYGCFVDMWAVGCIFAELVLGKALFQGKSEIEMLRDIFRVVPIPSREAWPMMEEISNCYNLYSFVPSENMRKPLRSVVPTLNECGFELLEMLLSVHPIHRISAYEMSNHLFVHDAPIYPLDRGLLFRK